MNRLLHCCVILVGFPALYAALWEVKPLEWVWRGHETAATAGFLAAFWLYFELLVHRNETGVEPKGAGPKRAPKRAAPKAAELKDAPEEALSALVLAKLALAVVLPGYLFFAVQELLSCQLWRLSFFQVLAFALLVLAFFWAKFVSGPRNQLGDFPAESLQHNFDLVLLVPLSLGVLFFVFTARPVMWFLLPVAVVLLWYFVACVVCCREMLAHHESVPHAAVLLPVSLAVGGLCWWALAYSQWEGLGLLAALALVAWAVYTTQGKGLQLARCLPLAAGLAGLALVHRLPAWLADRQFAPLQLPLAARVERTTRDHPMTVEHRGLWMYGRLIGSQCLTVFQTDARNVQVREDEIEILLRNSPSTYYHLESPAYDLFHHVRPVFLPAFMPDSKLRELRQRQTAPHATPARYAFVGMGAGDLVCYAAPGDVVDGFEPDPVLPAGAVRHGFSYVEDAKQRKVVVNQHLGPPLAKLRGANEKYDLLVVDLEALPGVSFDLLTKEAVEAYFERLTLTGVVAVHATRSIARKLPILQKVAEAKGLDCWYALGQSNDSCLRLFNAQPSAWIVLSRGEMFLPGWQKSKAAPIDQPLHDDFTVRKPSFFLDIAQWR